MVHTTIHKEKSLLVNSVKNSFNPVAREQFSKASPAHDAVAQMKKWLLWLMAV